MSRPTVLLLVSLLGVGGAERQMVTLANRLARRFDIVVVYIKNNDALAGELDVTALRALACLDSRTGLDLAAVRRLADLIDEYRVDVVLCANTYPLLYAHLARWGARQRPRVVEVYHTTILQTWKSRLQLWGYRPLFWLAHRLVYVCEAQRQYWRRRGLWARHQSVIYNGVDTGHFDPARCTEAAQARRAAHGFADDDLVVGLCAVMRPEKAHRDLLHALAQSDPCWKALLIGDGPLRPEIEREIDALGLRERVRITGYQSDVRPDLAACDLVALVSVTETFSMAALEAMAMGKPLLMSDVGGAREQVTPGITGWLFPAGDRAALAACLRGATDRSALQAMGRRARERVLRDYSLASMIDRYESMLHSHLSAAGTASPG